MSSLPVNGTPGGRAGSANEAPGKRLTRGGSVGDGDGSGVALEEGAATGLTLGDASCTAAGEHAVMAKRTPATTQRGRRVLRDPSWRARSSLDVFAPALVSSTDRGCGRRGTGRSLRAFCRNRPRWRLGAHAANSMRFGRVAQIEDHEDDGHQHESRCRDTGDRARDAEGRGRCRLEDEHVDSEQQWDDGSPVAHAAGAGEPPDDREHVWLEQVIGEDGFGEEGEAAGCNGEQPHQPRVRRRHRGVAAQRVCHQCACHRSGNIDVAIANQDHP